MGLHDMKVFEYLTALCKMEERCFAISMSLAERDICFLIGLYNERGACVTLKDLKSFDIAPSATLERSLHKLIAEGIVRQNVSHRDRRRKELALDKFVGRRLAYAFAALASSNAMEAEGDE